MQLLLHRGKKQAMTHYHNHKQKAKHEKGKKIVLTGFDNVSRKPRFLM